MTQDRVACKPHTAATEFGHVQINCHWVKYIANDVHLILLMCCGDGEVRMITYFLVFVSFFDTCITKGFGVVSL